MIPVDDTYTLYYTMDDGGRLWIDGDLEIDEWYDQSSTEHTVDVPLDVGLHDIKVEYYDNWGSAKCELRWSSSTIAKEILPHTALWGRESTNVLVSEDVQVPDGRMWDLLFFETRGGNSPIWYDLFDAHNDVPISGFQCLTAPLLDVSKLSASVYPRLNLRARWADGDPGKAPSLFMWGVKSMPERTWRTEFLTDIKVVGMVGLNREDGYVTREGTSTHTSIYAFAESFDGRSYLVDSSVRKGEYWQGSIPTVNATDVAMGDLDGDGLDEVLHTHGQLGLNATAYRGTAGGFDNAPTWTFPLLTSNADTSFFSHIVTDDLDGDGDTDVVLVAHDTQVSGSAPDAILIYLNDGSVFNSTPDEIRTTGGEPISSIDAGDINGDGKGDIAVGHDGGDGFVGILYGKDDWNRVEDRRFLGNPLLNVHVGDLDGNEGMDLFVGANLTGIPRPNNSIFHGTSGGLAANPTAPFSTPPSFAATYADWNGNGQRDVIFLTKDKVHVYLRTGSTFLSGIVADRPGVIDLATIDAGGDSDEDIAFAATGSFSSGSSGYMEAIGTTGHYARMPRPWPLAACSTILAVRCGRRSSTWATPPGSATGAGSRTGCFRARPVSRSPSRSWTLPPRRSYGPRRVSRMAPPSTYHRCPLTNTPGCSSRSSLAIPMSSVRPSWATWRSTGPTVYRNLPGWYPSRRTRTRYTGPTPRNCASRWLTSWTGPATCA